MEWIWIIKKSCNNSDPLRSRVSVQLRARQASPRHRAGIVISSSGTAAAQFIALLGIILLVLLMIHMSVCQQCFYFTKMQYSDDMKREQPMKKNIPLKKFLGYITTNIPKYIVAQITYRIIPVTFFVNMHADSCQKPPQTWRESCALLSKLPTRNPLLRIFHPFRLAMICDPSFLVRSIFSKF